ncbi:nucleotidyltransferase family protein [Emticicia sp. BO119]|nr:nucleotidyltransferase family protein [Emticicia sp. BO119]
MKPFAYGFDSSELFTDKFGEQEKLLLMIVVHNGKKEVWTKLKYICDLLLFVHQYGQNFDWDSFFTKLNNQSIEKSLLKGLALVNFFEPLQNLTTINREISEATTLNISFWEKAVPYEISKKARFDFYRLKFIYHKNIKESYSCLTEFIKYLSYPNPHGNRLIVFPKSYKLLNLSSTVLSYLYFNTFKRKN